MTNTQSKWTLVTIFVVVAIVVAGCMPIQQMAMRPRERAGRQVGAQAGMAGRFADVTDVKADGTTGVNARMMQTAIANLPVGTLSTDEKEGLLFMREEEKLAHDVYVTLGDKWSLPVFQNIPNSEQTHTEAVKLLLDRYDIADPADGKAVGVFTNQTLQQLYDQLVAKGNQSLADALTVGATVEDLDIADLQTRLAQTDKTDIQLVYENLMKGSRNHLRAFTQTLTTQTGETYEPQYLTQATFDAIVNTPMERGRNR